MILMASKIFMTNDIIHVENAEAAPIIPGRR